MSIGHLPRSHSASRDLPCQQLKQQLPADVLQSPMASQPTGSSDETRYKLLGCRPSSLGWNRLEAIASGLEAIAIYYVILCYIGLEAIALRLEAIVLTVLASF